MPTVDDYAPHAPFNLNEFVVAANRILGSDPQLAIKDRTVRYYIAERLLPPPSGGPKFARYGIEHLRRIVAIRQGVASGLTLEEIAAQLRKAEHGGSSDAPPGMQTAMMMNLQPRRTNVQFSERSVRRIRLSKYAVLEISEDADWVRALDDAIRALTQLREESES